MLPPRGYGACRLARVPCWSCRLRSYGATVSFGTSGKPNGPRSKREGTSDSGRPSPGSAATHHATSPWHGSLPRFVELGHILWRQVVVQCHVRPDAVCERGSTQGRHSDRSYGATISLRKRLPLGAKCAPRWPRRSPRQAAGLTTPGVADLHQWEQMGQGQLLCPRAAAAFQQSHRGVTVVVGARGAHHSGPHNFAQY